MSQVRTGSVMYYRTHCLEHQRPDSWQYTASLNATGKSAANIAKQGTSILLLLAMAGVLTEHSYHRWPISC